MTQFPPPGPSLPPVPTAPAAERIRIAYQARHQSDYIFSFWTALGWTVLTCGIFAYYVFYQLMRRMRDHNRRRLELLDAATTYAWEQAEARGVSDEVRPAFERIATHLAVLRQMTTEFRDPIAWTVLAVISGGIATIVGWILLDGDLVRHDYHEGAIEAELAVVLGQLGATVAPPDPARLKGRQNYVGRIVAYVLTCGIYGLWWLHDLMVQPNQHFEENWAWEDGLAHAVQTLG